MAAQHPGEPNGDVGRRIAHVREQSGLTVEELAKKVGADAAYMRYVEERAGSPSTGLLIRIAGVLGVTLMDLRGGNLDAPVGLGRAAVNPRLIELTEDECWSRLGHHGVGRVGLDPAGGDGPFILPVNYSVIDGQIAYRTGEDLMPARAAGNEVAFEVDRFDEAMSAGWSVLVTGSARHVDQEEEALYLGRHAHSLPWAGPVRESWVVITPRRLTGRRIETD